jgi:hypothetical protein
MQELVHLVQMVGATGLDTSRKTGTGKVEVDTKVYQNERLTKA